MNVDAIRTALDAALASLNIRTVQEIDQAPNVSGSAAAAMVSLGPVVSASFGDTCQDLTFTVVVLAARASERAARQKLDAIVARGPGLSTSLANAVEGDLGGTVAFCTVGPSSEYRNYNVGEADYLGCEFTVVIGT